MNLEKMASAMEVVGVMRIPTETSCLPVIPVLSAHTTLRYYCFFYWVHGRFLFDDHSEMICI